jgi:hypothetical protein
MISLNWVMVLPKGMSSDQFDMWYLGVHTRYGKASDGIIRYAVNRVVKAQPAAACGSVYRVAQEYWNDWGAMEACWNSPSGHAVLGDGLANIGLEPSTIPGIALTEDRRYKVAAPASFSTVGRGYNSRADGTLVKFLAYGMSPRKDSLAEWYGERFASLGEDPRLREHVFGTTVGRILRIGYLGALPGPQQKSYDWLLELWFDDRADAFAFLDSPSFLSMWSALQANSSETLAALFRGQEMLVAMDPIPHQDD